MWSLEKDVVREIEVTPATFGLSPHALTTVVGGTPSDNASTLISLLNGEAAQDDPIENFVVMNAAAVLFVAGIAKDPIDGVRIARESIKGGGAKAALAEFQRTSTAAAAGQ